MEHESQYVEAFNNAWIIHEHEPALAVILAEGFQDQNHPYASGFIGGVEQRTLEVDLKKDNLLAELHELRKDDDRDYERDFDEY